MKRLIIFLTILAALTVSAAAADYEFVTAGDTDYYGSTEYGDYYDSDYNYGGMNEIDFDIPEIRYGLAQEFLETSLYNPYMSSGVQYGLSYSGGSAGGSFGSSDAIYPQETGSFTVDYGGDPIAVEYTPEVTLADMLRDDGSIGTVTISSVGLEVKVYEGATTESMAKGAGHYEATSLWDGNVGLFGHNRGSHPHFKQLKNVEVGDIVTYETNQGIRTYQVVFTGTISYTDHTYLNEMGDNRITLTTCIADQPSLRLCVQAVEIK
jgi:LPXTG-site transpeptidase (sortase) family protein